MLNQLKVGQKILVFVMAVALVQLLTSMVTFQKSDQLNTQLNIGMERSQPATMAHLKIEGKDEIARAGHSFNVLISMLQQMMRDLANDVTHIDKTTVELSKSI